MNNVAAHRPTALTEADFSRLDELASNVISFSEREFYDLIWVKDEYGDPVQRPANVYTLPTVNLRANGIDPKLAESLLRPCNQATIGKHLFRLSCHKPYARGPEAWRVIISDLCRDLEGMSEYAIVKVCEYYRTQATTTYFPDTAALVARIRALDEGLRNASEYQKPEPALRLVDNTGPPPESAEDIKKRQRQISREKYRVGLLVKILYISVASRTKWQQRWWVLYLKRQECS